MARKRLNKCPEWHKAVYTSVWNNIDWFEGVSEPVPIKKKSVGDEWQSVVWDM